MKHPWKSSPAAVRPTLYGALLLVISFGITPQNARAQWTVFDPSTYAEMGEVWNQDVSMNVKLAAELQQGASLLTQTMQIYGLATREATYLSKGQVLQGLGFAAQHAIIPGQPGWDSAMMTAGGIARAGLTWQQMTNPSTSLQSRIQLANSFGTSALNAIGNCYAAAQSNSSSLSQLQLMVSDTGGAANTAANQRNVGNMTAAQQLRYHQCEENLQEQQAKLALLHAQEMMDRDQSVMNTNHTVDIYNAAGGGSYDTSPDEDLRRTGMH